MQEPKSILMMQDKSDLPFLKRFQYEPEKFEYIWPITQCPNKVFTVNPDKGRVITNILVVYRNDRWYLVDPDFYDYDVYIKDLYGAELYECVDSEGDGFLLINPYPLTHMITSSHESVLNVVEKARGQWIAMKEAAIGYDFQIVKDIKHQPRWAECSLDDLMEEAFYQRIIHFS